MNAAEAELTILLASVAARREAARDRIAELARRVDGPMYAARLEERGVLALLGSRLLQLAPGAAGDPLREHVDEVVRDARIRARALELTQRQVATALAEAGVRALPIKGLTFAERIYGDPGLRPATDVDVLVPRAQLARAVAALRELGYGAPTDPLWAGGLPELHHRLAGPHGAPRVEVHWRTHWAEDGLSEDAIAAAVPAPDGLLRAPPAHELALTMAVLARDGLHGPRLAADVAAWWDRCGARMTPGALDPIVTRNPHLRRPLSAVAACLGPLLGAPPPEVLTMRVDRGGRRALRLADPLLLDEAADVEAVLILTDASLAAGRAKLGFLRRYVVQPLPFVRSAYGPEDAPAAIVTGRIARHAARFVLRKLPRIVRAEARSRRTRYYNVTHCAGT